MASVLRRCAGFLILMAKRRQRTLLIPAKYRSKRQHEHQSNAVVPYVHGLPQ